MRTTRKTALATAALVLISGLGPTALVTSSATAATSCAVTWGSLAKTKADTRLGDGTITNVRAGRHTCYDRVVIDIAGVPASKVGFDIGYVDAVRAPGSGQKVSLKGGARLELRVTVPAYDSKGRATYSPKNPATLVNVTGWDTLRQVAMAGSFEGQTTFGVGVRALLPMRAFVLDGPGTGSRLVIDVAHRW